MKDTQTFLLACTALSFVHLSNEAMRTLLAGVDAGHGSLLAASTVFAFCVVADTALHAKICRRRVRFETSHTQAPNNV